MEAMEAEGQWTSLSGIYTAEEADFMASLLNNSVLYYNNQLLSGMGTNLPSFWPGHESTANMAGNYGASHCPLELSNSSFSSFSRGNSSTTSGDNSSVFPTSSNEHYCLSADDHSHKNPSPNNCSMPFDFGVGDLKTTTSYFVEGDREDRVPGDEIGDGSEDVAPEKSTPSDENSAKRPRCSENVEVGKRHAKSKKKQKLASIINIDGNAGVNNGQSSSSCCSGDESINGGQEMSGGDTSSLSPKGPAALYSDGKARARRGSATDPQSLYARKRRERINERLRILQNLIPNGTKVDISTMLEEAVQYVQFLQLQIKLLSSDELWMYAPIAYNGKDIGLDHSKLALAAKQS